MEDALSVERNQLINVYGIPGNEFMFYDGSGGSKTFATNPAITKWLTIMTESSGFEVLFNGLPILSVDGSLAFVTDFQSDPTLAGTTGQVHVKTGNYVDGSTGVLILTGQALGGYVDTKSGKRLVFEMAINEIPIDSIDEILQVFQDQGTISAILWRDY
jgi:D-alanyl-D-alanine carboxypeptidase